MKICVAQTSPARGDIPKNIDQHLLFIEQAVANEAGIVIFPELSLTGYEPTLAAELAIHLDDQRLDVFQQLSDSHRITIGVGAPLKAVDGVNIAMIIFQPHALRQTYSKQYLHADEEPFFSRGINPVMLIKETTALAICYEIMIPQHWETAVASGAAIYLASVAKSASGMDKAAEILATAARDHSMMVLVSNCVGLCDETICGGASATWNSDGLLLSQLNDHDEGILILDTNTQQVFEKVIRSLR